MALQVEQAVDDGVGAQETLRLLGRAEAAHAALPRPGRLVGQLRPVVRVAIVAVDRLGYQRAAGDTVAAQLVGHDLPWARAVGMEQPWVSALEPSRKQRAELVAPQPYRLVACFDPPLGEQVLDVALAEVEAMVEPDRVLDDGRREAVPLVETGRAVHWGMVPWARLT